MRSVNKVILVGNLTRDPQLKQTGNGQSVVTFGLATNRSWMTNDGQQQTSTEFHELVAWAKLAEIIAINLKTGKLVYVEGYLKTRSWDQEDGTKRYKTEVVVQDLVILSKKDSNDAQESEYVPAESQSGGLVADYNDDSFLDGAPSPESNNSDNLF